VQHRTGIGGAARHQDGGIIITGRNLAHKRFGETRTTVVVPSDPDAGIVGFNDLATDSAGRIYVGSVGFVPKDYPGYVGPRAGHLHRVDLDGSATIVADDILLPNGVALSSDGRTLYLCDSLRHEILAFHVDSTGDLHNRRSFARVADGITDGLAPAQDGSLWLAACHTGFVIGFDSEGSEIARIKLPVPMVTNVCFGGDNFEDLYIVSGPDGAAGEVGGCVFRTKLGIRGVPTAVARVRLPR
jgi:gluconolactonase